MSQHVADQLFDAVDQLAHNPAPTAVQLLDGLDEVSTLIAMLEDVRAGLVVSACRTGLHPVEVADYARLSEIEVAEAVTIAA